MNMTSKQSYQPLYQDDEHAINDHNNIHASSLRPSQRVKYILLGLSSLIVLAVAFIVFITLSRPTIRSSCGSTPIESRSRGCSFDLISFAWQMPLCYDEPLVSEFSTWDSWNFYTGNVTVTQDVAMQGEQSLWVSWHYHMVHCTFMWRQMHRAYERGWIDAHLRAYNHTLHCQKRLLMKGINDEQVFTKATVIYPVCEKVRGRDGVDSTWDKVYSS